MAKNGFFINAKGEDSRDIYKPNHKEEPAAKAKAAPSTKKSTIVADTDVKPKKAMTGFLYF